MKGSDRGLFKALSRNLPEWAKNTSEGFRVDGVRAENSRI